MEFRLAHIGLNCVDEETAVSVADRFSQIFDLETRVGNSSVFSGKIVEAMKTPYLGEKGHIAIATDDVDAARAYLEKKGIAFNEASAKTKDGRLTAIYLQEEIGGFAVHLVKA